MTKMRIAILAAAFAAVPALAQPVPMYASPWYFGVGVGQGHFNKSGTDLTGFDNAQVSNSETTYTIRAGWRFHPYMALELGYYDLGKYSFHGRPFGTTLDIDGQAKAKSVGLSLVGIVPIRQFDLYGRIGYARSELKINASAPLAPTPVNGKDKQNEATYGVGGRWNFTPQWGLFAEWMKNDKIDVDSYLIGVDFRF
ncbi:MAG TPA: porin family protein [Usitatibacter sp.]|jgi:opacity protein-like surface antigen|nr:porin family protein [Usitatibacter sp.]